MKRIDENHSFNVNVACLVGERKAILLKEIYGWCLKNLHNSQNVHGGYSWTYNTAKAYAKKFPYWSPKSIARWLTEMEADGWIFSANLNKVSFDRTKWYAINYARYDLAVTGIPMNYEAVEKWKKEIKKSFSQNEERSSQNEESDFSKRDNDISQNEETIPSLTISSSSLTQECAHEKEENTKGVKSEEKPQPPNCAAPPSPKPKKRFKQPTSEEIAEYLEDLFTIEKWQPLFTSSLPIETAEEIFDYYQANGWKVGKSPMKDWRAVCRNWLRRNKNYAKPKYRANVSRTPQQKEPLVSEETHRKAYARTLAALGITGS